MMVLFKTVIFYSYLNSRGPEIWQSRWHWWHIVLQKLLPSDPCYSKSVGFPGPFQPSKCTVCWYKHMSALQLPFSAPIYIYIQYISSQSIPLFGSGLHVIITCKPLPNNPAITFIDPAMSWGLEDYMVFLGEEFSGLLPVNTVRQKKMIKIGKHMCLGKL